MKTQNDYLYIVSYNRSEDINISIFATKDKEKAEMYVKRFNNILDKWKEYYFDKVCSRHYQIFDINYCSLEEIKIR